MTPPSGNADQQDVPGAGHARPRSGLGQLAALLADGLGEFANATLGLDAAGAARLAALEGSQILIQPRGMAAGASEAAFSLVVTGGRLRVLANAVAAPHAIVSGSLPDLLGWAVSRGRSSPKGLRIDGDTRLLEALADIVQDYRPDLEQPLARLLGAANATRVLATAEVAFAALRTALQTAATGVRHGAGQWFATDGAFARFLDELDELQLAVDRLDAHVAAVERRPAGQQDAGRPMP